MKTFKELIEAKIEANLLKTVPAAEGERKFVERHTVKDILAAFRANSDNSPFDGSNAKIYSRKPNRFGNDTIQSIKAYESVIEESYHQLSNPAKEIVHHYYTSASERKSNKDLLNGIKAKHKEGKYDSESGRKSWEKVAQTVASELSYEDKANTARNFMKAKKNYTKAHHQEAADFLEKEHRMNGSLKEENLDEAKMAKPKPRHIIIGGKYVGSTDWEPNNKKAIKRWLEIHPNEKGKTKIKVATESLSEKVTKFVNKDLEKKK